MHFRDSGSIIYFTGEIGIAIPEPQMCGHFHVTCIFCKEDHNAVKCQGYWWVIRVYPRELDCVTKD